MSVWSKIKEMMGADGADDIVGRNGKAHTGEGVRYVFVDVETGLNDRKIHDIGALRHDGATFHKASKKELYEFIDGTDYICGHNIINHDARYLFGDDVPRQALVDTLYMSPLMFPECPYHRLVKNDKLLSDQMNNPVNDCKKARDLMFDEMARWNALPEEKRRMYATLLMGRREFEGFLRMVGAHAGYADVTGLIRRLYDGKICAHADLETLVSQYPCELAYALALTDTTDHRSVTPGWVTCNWPEVEHVVRLLRHTRCEEGCGYCRTQLDASYNLKRFFGYDRFRTYGGEPLQEKAVRAAVDGKSLLAIFPTGGGKSLTFQLPALMEGHSVHGLTVVISPLQSLMKDQVDNLDERGITDAVTINGMLDPITRASSIQRVQDGDASLLYIAPEMLRSKTVERILMSRHVVRFVIDEAHCFSSWGQDFRVDYLYIGKFIREYQKKKRLKEPVPVSCFTATAKQKVVQDICDYFRNTLDLNMELFASRASRTNLRYSVIFMKDEVSVIVATSAFGMGVDKKDVGLVVHYDISDSLENYVQEAGRAGRDPQLSARCYVLYGDNDLDKHFILLNQTKLSISEIQQVWKAVKDMTRQHMRVSCSALEIARQAGWDDSVSDIETRVRTALATLEQSGYIERGNNVPHVYATGITVKNMDEARRRISESPLFGSDETETAARVIKSLISSKYISKAQESEAESRVDYLADILGMGKKEVVSVVERMRQDGMLSDSKDISAYLQEAGSTERRAQTLLERFGKLEQYILKLIPDESLHISCRQLNDKAINEGIATSKEKDIRTLIYFLTIKGYMRKHENAAHNMLLSRRLDIGTAIRRAEKRQRICRMAVEWLYGIAAANGKESAEGQPIRFSVVELLNHIKSCGHDFFDRTDDIQLEDVEEALLFLSKIGALKLEGGFLVIYNAMQIRRIKDAKFRYKKEDYRMLDEFYRQKIQQIHIVGEYANLMVRDYDAALQYVQDYFHMDYRKFISKYFKGGRQEEIQRNLTPEKYRQLFGQLSDCQRKIISDKSSRCIVVAAGPGSGKTRVLVHKLASLLLLEDVKHEQLLMLTFSRAAATEFKQRLMELIGNAAHFVEIKTFHSYCFDLLGRIGNRDNVVNVVHLAAEMIRNGDVEQNKTGKTVLVIDEAQDMGKDEYELVEAMMGNNEDMRVIAVGDDDQNIFEFRGSSSKYMNTLRNMPDASFVEMTENFRCARSVVEFANGFVGKITSRMKATPIVPVRKDDGVVEVTFHMSGYLYQPVMESLLRNGNGGTACVLTQTNEEAAIMMALLRRHGVKCKLIQSMDGLKFRNMAEMRYFMRCIDNRQDTGVPLVSDGHWEKAKQATFARYDGSTSLTYVRRCIQLFEETNKAKYITDFKEFVYESSVEDFCDAAESEVVISTIHKAKGREFDDVYMLISGQSYMTNELLRRYYVGITRARNRLFVHTNDILFAGLPAAGHKTDTQRYALPEEIVLQLSYKDVNLGYFVKLKHEVLSMRGGDRLIYDNSMLYNAKTGVAVAKLSKDMRSKVAVWNSKGYFIRYGRVRFVVAWKGKDAPKDAPETAVLLPDIVLERYVRAHDGV